LPGRLHDAGCERDKSGNRGLHDHPYCMLVLPCLFHPLVSPLRATPQAGGNRSQAGVWLMFRREDRSSSCDPAAEKCA